jgi:hypothetical protein
MEPDERSESNAKGFCKKHFALLYNYNNRLSLALIISTHISEINVKLSDCYNKKTAELSNDKSLGFIKFLKTLVLRNKSSADILVEDIIKLLDTTENSCVICEKLESTLSRYIGVIFLLWKKDAEFRALFKSPKGFCLNHFNALLKASKIHLNQQQLASFLLDIFPIQLNSIHNIQKEVSYFTKKFDYRYKDASWGNSKDSVPRSINKIKGFSRL